MRRTVHLLVALLFAGSIASCGEPDVDEFRREGGSAPDPTGVIEGTVLYIGPPPQCEFRGGVPVRPKGRIILTLFEYDNPPPPTGSATTAENLLTVPASELFPDLSDCLPDGEEPDRFNEETYIMRSVSFVWPEIHLAVDHAVSYQIRGFYDYDEDMNPFFSVTNLPTFGDVVGGALVRVPDPGEPSTFLPIEFPSQEDAPNGAVNDSPTITLGAVVMTERPVFELTGRGDGPTALSAEATIPITSDSGAREAGIADLTKTRLHMITDEDGSRGIPPHWRDALDAAGLEYSFDDARAYAWYVDEVDADGDGGGDLHPILGEGGGVLWLTPIIIARRAQTPDEAANGLPDVLLIGSVRPTEALIKQVFYPNMQALFAPIAAVDLNPENPACRVPYIPPNNAVSTYERIPVMCHELPTGPYEVSVIHGRAGSVYTTDVPSALSDTGFEIDESLGLLSGQAWSIPNELGDPTGTDFGPPGARPEDNQLGDPSLRLPTQGPEGRLVVHDPDGSTNVTNGCDMAVDPTLMPPAPRAVEYMEVDTDCCTEAVKGMCGLPLCEASELQPFEGIDAAGRQVHRDNNNNGVLDCVPFLPPPVCCE